MTAFGCDEFREIAPDLALGLLTGDERGDALTHVATCTSCRRLLDGLVAVTDDLLLLAPSVEPEIGFESRVMARLAASGAFDAPAPAPAPAPTQAPAPPLPAPAPPLPAPVPAATPARTDPVTPAPPLAPAASDSTAAAPPLAPAARDSTAAAPPLAPAARDLTAAAPPANDPIAGPPSPARPAFTTVTGGRRTTPNGGRRSTGSGDDRRWWTRPLSLAVAAALVVVVGIAGLTAGLNRGRNEGRATALSQATQTDNELAARTVVVAADAGKSTCQLVAFPHQGAQPARLVIHLDEPPAPPDSYQVYAVPTRGGPAVMVGIITVVDGQGTLTVSIPESAGPVSAVRVMDGGATRYLAAFPPV